MSADSEALEPPGGRSPARVTLLACAAVVLLAVAAVVVIQLTEPEAQREGATKRTPMLVALTQAERGTFRPTLTATGAVRAVQELTLEPRVSGQVLSVSPDFVPGRVVSAGAPLLQLDPADLKNALSQRQSALQQAEAALSLERGRQAVAITERAQFEGEVTPDQHALITRQPQLQSAEAVVEAAQAGVRQAELDLQRARITAPFDALVTERAVSEGSQVRPGAALGRLVGVDTYWVELTLPARGLQHLEPSDAAEVELRERSGWPSEALRLGRLESVVRQVDEQTRLARLLVAVDDPLALSPATTGPPLTAGAWVEARLPAKPLEDVLRLDRALLRKDDTVWVMDDEGLLQILPVELLLEDDAYVYIGGGLPPDARIVATDLSTVAAGAELRVAEAAP